jgi:hypothetical protein
VGYAGEGSGFANDIAGRLQTLRDWLQNVDVEEVAATLRRRFWAGRPPLLVGQMAQLNQLEEVSEDSLVRRRTGAVCLLEPDEQAGRLRAILGDRELVLPRELEATLLILLDGSAVQVKRLEDLDGESRVVLVRRLIREGLLECVG